MSGRRGYVVTSLRGGEDVLTAPTPPAAQSLASTATTASATWTHSGAPAGTTYACTVLGSDGSTPTATGSGLGAWAWPVVSSVAYEATLTATGPDGQTARSSALVQVQPDLATDFPVEGEAGWRRVFESDLTAETPQGPLAAGAGTVSIGGKTVPFLANATTGTFGQYSNTSISETHGLKLDLVATNSQLIQLALDIPLGETISRETSIRAQFLIRIYNGDSSDSAFVFISDPSIDPDNNESSSARTGGFRAAGTTTNLYTRRGGNASTAQVADSTWVNGTTDLYLTLIAPGYGNDIVILVSDVSFATADVVYRGRSNSRASNAEWDAGGSTFFVDTWSSLKVLFALGNGSAGTTIPTLAIRSIAVDLR